MQQGGACRLWESTRSVSTNFLPSCRGTDIQEIIERFYVHPTITRTIKREVAYFSIQHQGSFWEKSFKISQSLFKTVEVKQTANLMMGIMQ
jgi:hypothetical protein